MYSTKSTNIKKQLKQELVKWYPFMSPVSAVFYNVKSQSSGVFPKVYVFGHIRASIKVNLAIFLTFCIVSSFSVKLTNVAQPHSFFLNAGPL